MWKTEQMMEIVALLAVASLSWLASTRITGLRRSGSAERLCRLTRRALYAVGALCAALLIEVTLSLSAGLGFTEGLPMSPLNLQLCLIAIPGLFAVGCSLSRLIQIWKDTSVTTGAPLRAELHRQVTHPLLTLPLRLFSLSALAAAWCLIAAPFSFITALWLGVIAFSAVVLRSVPWRRRRRLLHEQNSMSTK